VKYYMYSAVSSYALLVRTSVTSADLSSLLNPSVYDVFNKGIFFSFSDSESCTSSTYISLYPHFGNIFACLWWYYISDIGITSKISSHVTNMRYIKRRTETEYRLQLSGSPCFLDEIRNVTLRRHRF
jgi:hypothetical protein